MLFSRPLLNAYKKASTGITGLAVHPNPRAHLVNVYKSTLKSLELLPAHSAYRQATEVLTTQRLEVVEKTEDIYQIEATLAAGQIEEVIAQAEDEAKLVPEMEKWKAWEPLEVIPPKDQWKGFNQ
ncbi:ETC complex I subunit conserved region-domain-containing protein [Piptocephalis cylindrospora]|uniref:ETC complex I subunit conserved region-domain-containing protein n=1 Tax=Piptocephalis cylindrospora TaxID=1907219 RepID=A0A4P9Y7J9_9FUNG|nr:ETC complex I subunit conserved region-domain-containing protein [Piptocephalis cylindrospora]|eukprot:RKP13890.1 ETC complex I subunit conserved region-domain-containing protein [Piptocephalis cylindrospora]